MVHIRQPIPLHKNGSVDSETWVNSLNIKENDTSLIHHACHLASIAGEDQLTTQDKNCFLKGLEIAEILAELKIDPESIAASLIYSSVEHTDLTIDDVSEQLGPSVGKIVQGVHQMNEIRHLRKNFELTSPHQIDNIRKMLLAMINDVRVVVIKLADTLSDLRSARECDENHQHELAQIAMEIFSPLANRLGLHTIKWELEDLSFFILEPETYKTIAKNLAERRVERDSRVDQIVNQLQEMLKKENIEAKIYGRAKHIYSIRKKMLRKHVDFSGIYDAIAVRILVPSIETCYTALSLVHEHWKPIPEEFDDYITNPKPNGYRSIHTAVIDENKNFEIQIRTFDMHEEAEKGVAAHWIYKEGKSLPSSYEEKINWLRQLLEWQKELTHDQTLPQTLEKNVFEDRIYVFTPQGDIIDLPAGATPLDFAYHIHTEVGHRCRGAKVNSKIVPLVYSLKTGDRVEILTTKENNPSRDWIVANRGYLKTSSARAKVLQWFKQQDYDTHVQEGRAILDRELNRLDITDANLSSAASKLNFKSTNNMLAALGSRSLRLNQLINLIHHTIEPTIPIQPEQLIHPPSKQKPTSSKEEINIAGIDHLLSRTAKCCKPLPGDAIIGYITQNQGITIHRRDCKNIAYAEHNQPERLIEIEWNTASKKTYPIDIEILAYNQQNLIKEITAVLANYKVPLSQLNTSSNKKTLETKVTLTIDIDNLEPLTKILDTLHHLPHIHSVKRIRQGR